jgi:hypothetical protein
MYYPYLYGRQSELLALRDVASLVVPDGRVVPVIEPVKENASSLTITVKGSLETARQHVYLIENPVLGDFAKDHRARGRWYEKVEPLFESNFVYPTFLCSKGATLEELRDFLRRFSGRPVGIVIRGTSISGSDIARAVRSVGSRTFFLAGTADELMLHTLGRERCVPIEDKFPSQLRNADYGGIEDFTDAHLTYARNGYAGFGDYTILGGAYSEGGGPLGAAAIHLTFARKRTREILVEHFVSDTVDRNVRDNDLKYGEAVAKIPPATSRRTDTFGLTAGVGRYLRAAGGGKLPNPGTNKRWSIAHHVDLMSGVLAGRFS